MQRCKDALEISDLSIIKVPGSVHNFRLELPRCLRYLPFYRQYLIMMKRLTDSGNI